MLLKAPLIKVARLQLVRQFLFLVLISTRVEKPFSEKYKYISKKKPEAITRSTLDSIKGVYSIHLGCILRKRASLPTPDTKPQVFHTGFSG